jgi:transmembrane sensor
LYRIVRRTAVAAGVVGIVMLAYIWERHRVVNNRNVADVEQVVLNIPATVLRHEENTTAKPRQLTLPDGSKVLLGANSMIEFEEPFAKGSREVTLNGKAEFAVQKDTANRFIVHSDQLSTTALGTRFSVTSFKGPGNIIIQLFEGRVMVQSSVSATTMLKKTYYLSPGEELIYVKHNSTATVRKSNLRVGQQSGTGAQQTMDEPSVPYNSEDSWYMFNNQQLPQVFERLEMLYKVEIRYSKNDLQNLYFIGRFKQTDSIDKILEEIVEINGLRLTHENGTFIIQK